MQACYLPPRALRLIAAFAQHEEDVALPPRAVSRMAVLRQGGEPRAVVSFGSRMAAQLAWTDVTATPPRTTLLLDQSPALHEALCAVMGVDASREGDAREEEGDEGEEREEGEEAVQEGPVSEATGSHLAGLEAAPGVPQDWVDEACPYAPVPAAWGLGDSMWLVVSARSPRSRARSLHWLDARRMSVTRSVRLPDIKCLATTAREPDLLLRADDIEHAYLVLHDKDGNVDALRVSLMTGEPVAWLILSRAEWLYPERREQGADAGTDADVWSS
jgi:hypothetical protein